MKLFLNQEKRNIRMRALIFDKYLFLCHTSTSTVFKRRKNIKSVSYEISIILQRLSAFCSSFSADSTFLQHSLGLQKWRRIRAYCTKHSVDCQLNDDKRLWRKKISARNMKGKRDFPVSTSNLMWFFSFLLNVRIFFSSSYFA